MRLMNASVATRSSGPAFLWSLFWMVCLICFLRSSLMSLRCAMWRMRVRGSAQANSEEKEGSQGWI